MLGRLGRDAVGVPGVRSRRLLLLQPQGSGHLGEDAHLLARGRRDADHLLAKRRRDTPLALRFLVPGGAAMPAAPFPTLRTLGVLGRSACRTGPICLSQRDPESPCRIGSFVEKGKTKGLA